MFKLNSFFISKQNGTRTCALTGTCFSHFQKQKWNNNLHKLITIYIYISSSIYFILRFTGNDRAKINKEQAKLMLRSNLSVERTTKIYQRIFPFASRQVFKETRDYSSVYKH